MLCPKCGWTNPNDSSKCANCQADLIQPMASQAMQQPVVPRAGSVPNYSVWSVIVTTLSVLSCNLPVLVLGIIAIVRSSSSARKVDAGDRLGAAGDANTALILAALHR